MDIPDIRRIRVLIFLERQIKMNSLGRTTGDKIKSFSVNNLASGNNYVTYNGRDDKGNILYNGTYLCIIKKKYTGREETEKCRLLIIK
jgi:hypothetical protein